MKKWVDASCTQKSLALGYHNIINKCYLHNRIKRLLCTPKRVPNEQTKWMNEWKTTNALGNFSLHTHVKSPLFMFYRKANTICFGERKKKLLIALRQNFFLSLFSSATIEDLFFIRKQINDDDALYLYRHLALRDVKLCQMNKVITFNVTWTFALNEDQNVERLICGSCFTTE